MGRKQSKKNQKERQEEQVEQESYSIPEQEQFEEDEQLDPEEEHQKRELDVLEIIGAQTKEGTDGEKLTWLALYSLKLEEIELNEKMNEEINLLKDRYELLKQPLYAQIATAAVGKEVEAKLYKPEGFDSNFDLKTVKPTALPDYWVSVFQRSGLIEDQNDFEALRKLEELKCELLDATSNHILLSFKFKEAPALFSNKELSIEIKTELNGDQQKQTVVIKEAIVFKGKNNEESVFYVLFNPSSDPDEVSELVREFYRDYSNSIYFYMRKQEVDVIDVDDQDEEEQKESAKQKKKKSAKKGEIEKPECKQQ